MERLQAVRESSSSSIRSLASKVVNNKDALLVARCFGSWHFHAQHNVASELQRSRTGNLSERSEHQTTLLIIVLKWGHLVTENKFRRKQKQRAEMTAMGAMAGSTAAALSQIITSW